MDNLPDRTGNAAAAQWAAKFFAHFADLADAAGYPPLIGAIPSGKPALSGELGSGSENLFEPIATAMKAKSYRWGWSYHAFSTYLAHDSVLEAATTLRYRRIVSECGLELVPLVITATGQAGGWLNSSTSATAYLEWLDWLDAQLKQDGVPAALFQFGDTASQYELAGIADGLVNLLTSTTSRDAGLDAIPGAPATAALPFPRMPLRGARDLVRTGGTASRSRTRAAPPRARARALRSSPWRRASCSCADAADGGRATRAAGPSSIASLEG
ncbi:MAG: hypothetical protein QM765_47975 [Myxococcales bacterium]